MAAGTRPCGGAGGPAPAPGAPGALLAPRRGCQEAEQQEKLTFTGARGLCCGFILDFFFFFLLLFFFDRQQHEEEEETHPASTLICNQTLRVLGGLSDGISPAVGVLPAPSTRRGDRHGAGDPGPQTPPGTAASLFYSQAGSVLIQGAGGDRALSSLPLHFSFFINEKT